MKNTFYNPVTLATYEWAINHTEQNGPSRESNTQYEGQSSDLGIIGFQGQDQPLIIELRGKILHKSQYLKFWEYRHITNTFKFTDFESNIYEVTMTGLVFEKRRVAWNFADAMNMPFHTYDYTMTLRVLTIISGDLFGLGVPV